MKQLKFEKNDRKQISFYWSAKEYKRFVERFPNLTTFFLTKVMERAVNEAGFFESVVLGDSLASSNKY